MFDRPLIVRAALAVCLLFVFSVPASAADWPQARFDAGHTGSSPEQLAERLHLQWSRELPSPSPAWLDQPKLTFDAAAEPIVVGGLVIVGSSRHDCVSAFELTTGKEVWTCFADAPVRLAPCADAGTGNVFFASDDGHLHCVNAASGELLWKFRGGPADQKVVGNERLVSAWPARGGPVVANGTVYFAASIWPFMGIFVHALDANTGKVIWTNDGDGSLYMKQPHSTDSFASVAPQGQLTLAGDVLLVPGGRSVPACFDRRTGKLLRYLLNENSKKGGGSEVTANAHLFFNGEAAFDAATEKHLGSSARQPVLFGNWAFGLKKDECAVFDMTSRMTTASQTTPATSATATPSSSSFLKPSSSSKSALPEIAALKVGDAETLIRAGLRLYLGGRGLLAAVRFDGLNSGSKPTGTITWQQPVSGSVVRLAAADGQLIALTREGSLLCFGAKEVKSPVAWKTRPLSVAASAASESVARARTILQQTKTRDGYAVVIGDGAAEVAAVLAASSHLRLLAIEPDVSKVAAARTGLVAAGLYGERVTVLGGRSQLASFPPYLASLVVALHGEDVSPDVSRLLRPYGGELLLPQSVSTGDAKRLAELKESLPEGKLEQLLEGAVLRRDGAIPGAANWTHEHADASNTRVSRDQVVKAPLGLLWFGGPTNEAILPRHGHGPQPQVVDGRMIVEGMDILRAIDIYTGRLLWETSLPGIGKFYNNVAHQPGANSAGSNYVSQPDGIFAAFDNRCVQLNPADGKPVQEFRLPPLAGQSAAPRWGYLNVVGDALIGGADPILNAALARTVFDAGKSLGDDDKKVDPLLKLRWKALMFNDNLSASRHLVVMDRATGKVRWQISAEHSFRHNATCVGGGKLYTIDRPTSSQIDKLKRDDVDVKAIKPQLLAFDLKTGEKLWSTTADVFGTWLSYSEKHDVLVESGRNARDTLLDEPKGMRAYRAARGEVLWTNMSYIGPAILHGDKILRDTKACDLLTGAPTMRPDPLTGKLVEWAWSRNYGCNTPAASEHLLTFRSGAAGFFDLCHDGGTANLGGFRSSCTNNLIVAGGVLAAPDYTRTCSCSYQNQTSIGLIHMPGLEMWTMFGTSTVRGAVKHVGLNFGAPGDRRAEDGTLWLEYPTAGGNSPTVAVKTEPEKPATFRRHESQVTGDAKWVAASGFVGANSITLSLDTDNRQTYTVKLVFAEPESIAAGQRRFHVSLNGREVLHDFDIVAAAGAPLRSVIREFTGVEAKETLTIGLTPANRKSLPPVICGVELRANP